MPGPRANFLRSLAGAVASADSTVQWPSMGSKREGFHQRNVNQGGPSGATATLRARLQPIWGRLRMLCKFLGLNRAAAPAAFTSPLSTATASAYPRSDLFDRGAGRKASSSPPTDPAATSGGSQRLRTAARLSLAALRSNHRHPSTATSRDRRTQYHHGFKIGCAAFLIADRAKESELASTDGGAHVLSYALHSCASTLCPRPQEGWTAPNPTSNPADKAVIDKRFTGPDDSVHTGCAEASEAEQDAIEQDRPSLRDARILPGRRCEPSWCSRELRLQSLGLLHVLSSDPLQSRLTHRSVDRRHLTVPSSLVRPYFCCARPFRARDGQTIPSSGAHSVGIGQMKLRHLRSPIAWP